MQQRYSDLGSSPSPSPQQIMIKLTEQHQHHYTKRFPIVRRSSSMADFGCLPVYDPRSGLGKKEIRRSLFSEKWIHAIPFLLFLTLIILFWFCYPVTVEIKNGKIIGIHRINQNMPSLTVILNGTGMDIGVLSEIATTVLSQDVAAVPQSFIGETGTKEIALVTGE